MTSPSELSLEEIRRYLLAQGGSARNQDLVIYFKKFLTDPETRVEARNRFKEYINTLATIKTEEGEKFLVLKKKFRQASLDLSSPTLSFAQYPTSPLTPDLTTPTSPLKDLSLASPVRDPQPPSLKDHFKTPVRETIPPPVRGLALQSSPSRTPPPYRPPPVAPLSPLSNTTSPIRRFPVEPPIGLPLGIPIVEPAIQHVLPSSSSRYSESESESSNSSTLPPSVPPRRKSQDKIKFSNKENQGIIDKNKNASETIKEDAMSISSTTSATSSQQQQQPQMAQQQQQQQQKEQQQQLEQLSVKERMQRFNRLATETDLAAKAAAAVGVSSPPAAATSKKRVDKGTEEDDRASVASFLLPAQQQLDAKSREWLVRAAQGDYQALAKLAAEEPRLARTKDPSSTALHWGAKHGDENIIKLIAGTYRDYIKSVNETSNGGYTPLHIAVQFSHENIYNLLVQVYGANQDVRDYSGRKARQYSISQKAAVSQDTMRKIKARKKHAEKDLGFLRIGSLNVRVKRTTEAFSQFLGVTTNNAATSNEKIHKSWGSADHLPADQLMPPPKYGPIKKRRSRRATDFISSRSSTGNGGQSPGGTPPPSSHRRPSSVSTMMTSPLHEEQPPSPSSSTASGTNNQQQQNQLQSNHDSDSDGACGFDSRWHGQF